MTLNEKRKLEKSDTHRAYWKEDGQKNVIGDLLNKLVQIHGVMFPGNEMWLCGKKNKLMKREDKLLPNLY